VRIDTAPGGGARAHIEFPVVEASQRTDVALRSAAPVAMAAAIARSANDS
jgi:hypothetical protein